MPPQEVISNVDLLILPANTTCKLPSLYLEITQLYKLYYQHHIMTTLTALIDSIENVDELIKKISLAVVMEYIKEV